MTYNVAIGFPPTHLLLIGTEMSHFDRESPINPYASPIRSAAPAVGQYKLNEAETIRNQMLKHEVSIRSFGTLYLIGSGMTLLIAIPIFVSTIAMKVLLVFVALLVVLFIVVCNWIAAGG